MPDDAADRRAEALVKEYLKGRRTLQEAVADIPHDRPSVGEVVLNAILPTELARRRVENRAVSEADEDARR